MKAKHSIKIDHDKSPSTAGEVVNSTTNIVMGNERGSINHLFSFEVLRSYRLGYTNEPSPLELVLHLIKY
jgi:hypothetical protein